MKLDFYEFLKSMFFFLSQSRTELAMFAFQLFDPDDSDSLTGEELRTLANCVNPGFNFGFGKHRYKRLTLNETIDRGYNFYCHHYHYRRYHYNYRYLSQAVFV